MIQLRKKSLPKVLGNKRDLPGALNETELIEMMGLNSVQVPPATWLSNEYLIFVICKVNTLVTLVIFLRVRQGVRGKC